MWRILWSLDIFDVCVYISNFLYLEIPESIRFILYECLNLDASVAQSHQHPVTCARSVTIIGAIGTKEDVIFVVDVGDAGDAADESRLSL